MAAPRTRAAVCADAATSTSSAAMSRSRLTRVSHGRWGHFHARGFFFNGESRWEHSQHNHRGRMKPTPPRTAAGRPAAVHHARIAGTLVGGGAGGARRGARHAGAAQRCGRTSRGGFGGPGSGPAVSGALERGAARIAAYVYESLNQVSDIQFWSNGLRRRAA